MQYGNSNLILPPSLSPVTISSVTAGTGVLSDIVNGTSTTNGITYNVYAFKPPSLAPSATTSQLSYTVNYSCANATIIYVLAVGGGGGGGSASFNGDAGGGAGGVVMTPVYLPAGSSSITVSIGAGGTVGYTGSRSNVSFTGNTILNIIAGGGGAGGGAGGAGSIYGGSGGGSYGGNTTYGAANNSNKNFANIGGVNTTNTNNQPGSGGGGAGTAGPQIEAAATNSNFRGGDGIQCFLPGISQFKPSGTEYGNYYWGGGGGGGNSNGGSFGGKGGGGGGAYTSGPGDTNGINPVSNANGGTGAAGGTNTGGGGGGGWYGASGSGGSGVVVIAFPSSIISINTGSVLTNTALTSSAYNNIRGSYGCKLLNYNYYGPIMTLRHTLDTTSLYTKNFYSDTNGNLYTGYTVSPNNKVGNSATTWTSNGITWTADSTYASSNYPAYLPNRAFDGTLGENNSWSANGNNYATASSTYYLYSGGTAAQTIISGGVGTINGEWMQISSNTPVSLSSFAFGSPHGSTDAYSGRIPGQFYIVGSNSWSGTAQSWTPIAYCVFTGNPYITSAANTYTYTYSIPKETVTSSVLAGNMTITTYGNSSSTFTYYRFVATALLGSTGGVSFSANGLMIGEWVLNCVNPAATTPGYSVSNWLSDTGANTTYAFVTKWYDQGMDLSFNCASQYAIAYQPMYDVTNKVINFGYTSGGPGLGGVAALNPGYFNIPTNGFPMGINDCSFTVVTKYWNYGTLNSDSQQDLITFNTNYGSLKLNDNGHPSIKIPNNINSANGSTLSSGNTVVSYKYTSYSTIGNNNNSIVYMNNVAGTPLGAAGVVTASQGSYVTIGNGTLNTGNTYNIAPGAANFPPGTGTSYYLQAQLYYLYVFSSALTDQDRGIIEST